MNIHTGRRMDDFFGPLICLSLLVAKFLLSKMEVLNGTYSEKGQKDNMTKKILVIKFYGIGSIVLSSAVLRGMKKRYPNSKIYFLTFEENVAICRMLNSIDEVISLNVHKCLVKNTLALFKRIWRERFDIVFDFEYFAYFTAIVTFFTRCANTTGFCTFRPFRDRFYSNLVVFDHHSKHIRGIFAKAVKTMGVEDCGGGLEKFSVREDWKKERVTLLLKKAGIWDNDYKICVNINASSLSYNRRLPKEHYRKILQGLVNIKGNVKFILIGGPADKKYVEGFCSEVDESINILNLCGELDWDELVALFEVCDLCIGNDSGPLHVAAAVGLPTVSFFGPETPALYGPLEDNHLIFYKDLPCSPCLNVYNAKRDKCKDNRCLKEMDPQQIVDSIKSKYFDTR